jgi:glyoxylase I family protein
MSIFQIRGLDHIVLRVADKERALAFYVGVLGLTVEREQPKIGLTQLRAGNSLIDLVPRDATPAGQPNMDHFALEIMPYDEAALRRYLAARGVEALESGQRYGAGGSGPSLYLLDPDGNKLELKGPATAAEGTSASGGRLTGA